MSSCRPVGGKLGWVIALPFLINLVANLIFTPIQFGWRNLPLAAVDILIVWSTILWAAVAIWPHYRWVSRYADLVFHLGLTGHRATTVDDLHELGSIITWI